MQELVGQVMNWFAQQLPALPANAITETAAGIAKAFGSDIWSKLKSFFAKSGKGDVAEALEADPTHTGKQAAFQGALHELLEQDPSFADELRRLLPAAPSMSIRQTGNNNTGVANIGGGTVTIIK